MFELQIDFSSPDSSGILLRLPAFKKLEASKDRADSGTSLVQGVQCVLPKITHKKILNYY